MKAVLSALQVPLELRCRALLCPEKRPWIDLRRLLDELKPEYKEIIVLKKVEGLSYVETGKRLNALLRDYPDAQRYCERAISLSPEIGQTYGRQISDGFIRTIRAIPRG